ncbi:MULTISPECIES: hypothetical protein [Thermomonospora]|uniref:Lipoprotein n=1 Tax=Thermomonospora curvata (strain ATCC 19995 / DSM 43183 / JCM 3096 / KCTC 9072 / NBRC 15933 / NCIMB 10081 / Henssen B9) TaxID=471852 RepID=D1A8N0_THECD|nr:MULTISPECIES: hypothetical protein [Thermomonospora]ACY96725.1 hypothetical protein Tcur_1140 [Thermomonospora curvata DSM 43183]PKK15270.1 MAG: hypothetical protein BUE48_005540 [Thermomonospora sp. CIF 1]
MLARLVRPLGLLTLTGLTAACASGSSGKGTFRPSGSLARPAASDAAQAAPHTLPTEQVDAQVLQSYAAYQKAYKKAYETNDPSPLSEVATDPLLTTLTEDIERTRAKGVIWRFVNISNPRVYARSDDGYTVYVVDCMRTLAAYRFSAKTGKRLGGGPGGTYQYRTAVTYESGAWKVSNTKRDKPC